MHTKGYSHGGLELAEAVRESYTKGQTDYSLEPLVLADSQGEPLGRLEDGDAVIFCCRRGDREIQLTEAFCEQEPDHFPRKKFTHLPFVILTLYHEKFKDLPVAFAPTKIRHTLSETLSKSGLRQLHISESEKFSHVTFFFNGGNNQPFAGEKDIRVPSPRGTPFDQIPGLSLDMVEKQLCQELQEGYDFLVANFANGDVIGHTQNTQAKVRCAEVVDEHLGRVVEVALAANYLVMVTADHGNLEQLYTPEGKPHVSHTENPVPLILIPPAQKYTFNLSSGRLADIAPTILAIMGIKQPPAMTGHSLVEPAGAPVFSRVLLIILDGWGIGKNDESNPIAIGCTPTWDSIWSDYPHTTLQAAGEQAGLQAGKAGNSEAGHLNIGAGRLVLQDDVRLEAAIQDGSFCTNEIFQQTIAGVRQRHARLHLIGLLSEKSSHGTIDYPLALLNFARECGLTEVYIHIIFDGRSTEPGSAPGLLESLEQEIQSIGIGKIVTGMGRSIALDRDGNYSKTKTAYDALVYGDGRKIITDS